MKQWLSITLTFSLALTSPAPFTTGWAQTSAPSGRSIANTEDSSGVLMDAALTAQVIERLSSINTSYQIEQSGRDLQVLKTELEQNLNRYLSSDFATLQATPEGEVGQKTQQAFAQTLLYFQLAEKLEGQKTQNQSLSSPLQWSQIYGLEIDLMRSLNNFAYVSSVLNLAQEPESPFQAKVLLAGSRWVLQLSLHPNLYDSLLETYLASRFQQDVFTYSRFLLAKDQYQNLARINGLLRRPIAQLPSPSALPVFQNLLETVPEFIFLKDILAQREQRQLKKHIATKWAEARDLNLVAANLFIQPRDINQMLATLKLDSQLDAASQVAAIEDLIRANINHLLNFETQLISSYDGPWSMQMAADLSSLAQYLLFNASFTRSISTFKNLAPETHLSDLEQIRDQLFVILQTARSKALTNLTSIPKSASLYNESEIQNQFLLDTKRAFVEQLNADVENVKNVLTQTQLPIDMGLLANVLSGEFDLSGYHARWMNQLIRNNDYATATVQYHEFIMNQLEAVGVPGDALLVTIEKPSYETYQSAIQSAYDAQTITRDQKQELDAFLDAGQLLGFYHAEYLANTDDLTPLLNATLADLNLSTGQLKKYQQLYAEKASGLNHLLSLYMEDHNPLYTCNPTAWETLSPEDPLWKNWSRFQGVKNQHCAIDQYLLQMEKSAYKTLEELNPEDSGLVGSALGWLGSQFDSRSKQKSSNQHIIELLAHSSLYTAALQTHSHFDTDVQKIVESYAEAPPARALFDKLYNEVLHPIFWATLFYQIAKFGLRFVSPNIHSGLNKFEKQLLTPFFGSRYQLASGVMLVAILGYLGLEIKDTVGEAQVEKSLRAYHFSSFDDDSTVVKTADWSQQQQTYKAARNSLYLTAALLGGFVVGIYAVRGLFHSYMKNYARTGAFVKKHRKFIEEGLGFQSGRWSLTRENTQGALRAQINRIRQSSNMNAAEKERLIAQYKKHLLQLENDLEGIGRAFMYAPPHLTRAVYELGLNNVSVVGRNTKAWADPSRLTSARSFWENQYKTGQINFAQWQVKKSQLSEVAQYAQAQKNWYKTSQEHLEAAEQGARRARPLAQQSDDFLSLHNEFQWTKGAESLNWDLIKNQNDWLGILDAGFRWKIIQKGRHWRLEAEAVDRSATQNRLTQEVRKLIEDKTNRSQFDNGWKSL